MSGTKDIFFIFLFYLWTELTFILKLFKLTWNGFHQYLMSSSIFQLTLQFLGSRDNKPLWKIKIALKITKNISKKNIQFYKINAFESSIECTSINWSIESLLNILHKSSFHFPNSIVTIGSFNKLKNV